MGKQPKGTPTKEQTEKQEASFQSKACAWSFLPLFKKSLDQLLYEGFVERIATGPTEGAGFRHTPVGQNPVPLVNIKIGGIWVFIRPKSSHRS